MYPHMGSAKQVMRRRVRLSRARRGVRDAEAVASSLGDRAADLVALVGGPAPGPGLTVALYASLPGEPGTGPLRVRLAGLGHRVLLPWLQEDRDLDWVVDDTAGAAVADPMRPPGARLGPGAAAGADLLLVPALAVDGDGTRLGQGGGSYDRALVRLAAGPAGRDRPLVLAVVHDDELLPAGVLTAELHDVPVDGAVTPVGVRLLRPGVRLPTPGG